MLTLQKTLISLLTALSIALLLGPLLLPLLRKLKFGQEVRDDGPQSHLAKQGTPTMGGILFLVAALAATLIFDPSGLALTLPAIIVTFAFAFIGFLDDYIKVRKHRSLGLRAWQKIVCQFGFALGAAIWLYQSPLVGSQLILPGGGAWDLGIFYIPFAMFVIIAEVNAVNLTDGLDGLAAGVSSVFMGTYALLFLLLVSAPCGMHLYEEAYAGMAIFSAALCGALLGYLAYNSYPAKVFMGDTGALGLGGAVAMVGLLSRSAILLPLSGVCFLASAVSVILQVGSYKLRNKKRIFRMAPLHHHFEQGGAHEAKIVTAYTIVTVIGCALCLLLYTL
ncbi:MAG: phospho-N-acetylmuramoyl-pentapeptide-transferase [Clostridiales bacterium]|nr:phospho-N-acetylmuramoyl-pentapeptide-transferase [Clostridiales bacterium]